MVAGGGLEPSKGVSCLRPNRVLPMGERERETTGSILPRSLGGRQMYLPKFGIGTRQSGCR